MTIHRVVLWFLATFVFGRGIELFKWSINLRENGAPLPIVVACTSHSCRKPFFLLYTHKHPPHPPHPTPALILHSSHYGVLWSMKREVRVILVTVYKTERKLCIAQEIPHGIRTGLKGRTAVGYLIVVVYRNSNCLPPKARLGWEPVKSGPSEHAGERVSPYHASVSLSVSLLL